MQSYRRYNDDEKSHQANPGTAVNPQLEKLHPYPFEKLRQLFSTETPNPEYPAISLGMG